MNHLKSLGLLALLGMLAACSNLSKTPVHSGNADPKLWQAHQSQLSQVHSWDLSGKLAVRNSNNNGSGTLSWQQQHEQFDIRISGPLGQGAIQLRGDTREIELITSKQQLSSRQPEALMQQQLGWSVPLENLLWWIRGLPAPNGKYTLELGDDSLAWKLEQSQWQLEYLSYQTSRPGYKVPQRIRATGPEQLQLIIMVKDWQ